MVTLIPHKMDISIQPTVQEVGVTGAVMASKTFSFLKKKSGGARRALAALGPNNAKFNLNMAQSHLSMAQDVFTSRWNFNPAKETPLPQGRYQWAPFNSGSDKCIIPALGEGVPASKDITLLKDITNPTLKTSTQPTVTSAVTDLHKSEKGDLENNAIVLCSNTNQENSDTEDTSDTENRKQGPSHNSETILVSTKNSSSKSQICITEFFKPQKRKSSYNCEDSLPITPPKKKLRTIH